MSSNKTTLFKPYKSISAILKIGIFNSLLMISSAVLFLAWLLSAAQSIWVRCSCVGITKNFLFIEDIFPAIMSLDYLLKWLSSFLISVILEIGILSFLAIKARDQKINLSLYPLIAFLSFLHNLPGIFLVLTLMSKAESSTLYKLVFLSSVPLVFIFRIAKHKDFTLHPIPVSYELVPHKTIKKIAFYSIFLYFGYLMISTGLWMLLIVLPMYVVMLIASLFQ